MFWSSRPNEKFRRRPPARVRHFEPLEGRALFAADIYPTMIIPPATADAASEEVAIAQQDDAAAGSPTIASSGYIRVKKLNSG